MTAALPRDLTTEIAFAGEAAVSMRLNLGSKQGPQGPTLPRRRSKGELARLCTVAQRGWKRSAHLAAQLKEVLALFDPSARASALALDPCTCTLIPPVDHDAARGMSRHEDINE